jgi:tetratricopeptide (TPR) repeat protein
LKLWPGPDAVYLTNRARFSEELGRLDEALTLAEQALAIDVEHTHTVARIVAIEAISAIYSRLGRAADAAELLTETLATCRDIDNAKLTARLLNTLGETHQRTGDYTRSIDRHGEAYGFAARAGDLSEIARSALGLGDAHALAGDTARAREYWTESLQTYSSMGLPAAARVRRRLDGG